MSSRKFPIKRVKGQPVHQDELKKRRTVWLTETAWNNVKRVAAEKDISLGEFIEDLLRNLDGTTGHP